MLFDLTYQCQRPRPQTRGKPAKPPPYWLRCECLPMTGQCVQTLQLQFPLSRRYSLRLLPTEPSYQVQLMPHLCKEGSWLSNSIRTHTICLTPSFCTHVSVCLSCLQSLAAPIEENSKYFFAQIFS